MRIEPSSGVKALPERPTTMMATGNTPISRTQHTQHIDYKYVCSKLAELEEALLGDNAPDQKGDEDHDWNSPPADLFNVMDHRGEAET